MGKIMFNSLISPLIKSAKVRKYSAGQTILYPEDNSPHLYAVKDGAVALESIDKAGDRKILYIYGSSTLFPLTPFEDKDSSVDWFYTTLTETEAYLIPSEDFKKLLSQTDGLTIYNSLVNQTISDQYELLMHISSQTKTDSKQKLISSLMFLFKHHTNRGVSTWRKVLFPVSHQLLADMTGLSRESVTLIIKDLTQNKLLRYKKRGLLELNANKLATTHSL